MTDVNASSIEIKLYVKARTKPLFYPLPWRIQDSRPLQVQKPHISQEIFGKEWEYARTVEKYTANHFTDSYSNGSGLQA
jgi:hypothetical protein